LFARMGLTRASSTPMRCLHLNSAGEQCPMPAMEGAEFCEAHLPTPLEEAIVLPWAYRLTRRLGAAVLLGIIVLQLYVMMKMMLDW